MGGGGGLVGGVVVGGVVLSVKRYGAGVETYTGLPCLFRATLIAKGAENDPGLTPEGLAKPLGITMGA